MKLKQVFALFTVALLFLGSVGVPIYKHTCLHEQQTIRTFFLPSNHCSPESSPESIADACCEEPASTSTLEEHCCVEDVSYFQFHSYSWEYNPLDFQLIALAEPLVHVDFTFEIIKLKASNQLLKFPDPPPISGRERLISHCIWRI
jgi:hypothetical protein